MFVTLQGENYTANLYLYLAIYPLYHKENFINISKKFFNKSTNSFVLCIKIIKKS